MRHRGTTTAPIDVHALRARLDRERLAAGRPAVAPLRVPRLELAAPRRHRVVYTPTAYRHVVGVAALAVATFLLTFAVATWVNVQGPGHGWARWMREPVETVQPAYAPVRPVPAHCSTCHG